MVTRLLLVCFLTIGGCAAAARAPLGADLELAPPAFTAGGKRIVPADFQRYDLDVVLDVTTKKATGRAHIDLVVGETGFPMFDLVPKVTAVMLDGTALGAGGAPEISAPDAGVTKFRYVDKSVSPGAVHRLTVEYELTSDELSFTSTGASLGFFMSDVGDDRDFLEAYAPSNFEFDHFPLQVTLTVKGAGKAHQLFTNGEMTPLAEHSWRVTFPSWFTTSSPYLHVTEKAVTVKTALHKGKQKTVPLTVYSQKEQDAIDGLEKAERVLTELDETYGTLAHDRVVVYIAPQGGGMEYCGATITSLWALGHELTHSYFARGYMPASGNAGWMDEAIASWRDNEYPTAKETPNRPPVNLAAFSPFRRTTPYEAYGEGAQLISELDFLLSPNEAGGFKGFLRRWFELKQHEVTTTEQFREFLETHGDQSLGAIFERYVYGKGSRFTAPQLGLVPFPTAPTGHHPRPFTKAERAALR